jgi:hypothetical protein
MSEDEISSESMDETLKKMVYDKSQTIDNKPIDNPEVLSKKKKKKGKKLTFNLTQLGLVLGIKKEPRKFNPRFPPLD